METNMPNNWKKYKLHQVAEIKYGKDHKFLKSGSIPVYGSGGVMRYGDNFLYDKPSILIPRKGTLSNLFYIDKPFWSVDTMFWSKIAEGTFPKYLFYNLKTLDFASMDVGSAVPSLTTELLNRIDITLPPLPEQQAIAEILSSLDDKIELNLQTNKTLEEMANALYKHWFVDFGPFKTGKFIESELGMIPEGWEMKTIGNIATVIDCLHSKKPELFNDDNGNLFLQLENILDNGILDLSKKNFISTDDYKKWTSRIEVKYGDCVITNVGRSGAVARIPMNVTAAMGRNMTAIRLQNHFPFKGFLITMLCSSSMKRTISKFLDTGTILEALNVKNIPKLHFFAPKNFELIKNLEPHFSNLRDKMEENIVENEYIKQTRDYLLPKLISGEIQVKEGVKKVKELI
jgi:type I restriction enzyme S subunit